MDDILIFIVGVFVGVLITGVMIILPVLMYWPEETPNKRYWPEDE